MPREQFFNTDYFDLIRDRFSNVLDTQVTRLRNDCNAVI